MFGNPSAPVIRFIQRAAKIYKHIYGDYPEMVGLDIFTRFREWGDTPFVDVYYWRDLEPMPVIAYGWSEPRIAYTNVSVKVEPVTFSPVKYNAYRTNPRPADPTQGQNAVYCKRGEHEIAMDIRITTSGYHAVIGEKRDLEAWQEFKAAQEDEEDQHGSNE